MPLQFKQFYEPVAFMRVTTAERDALDYPPDGTVIFNVETGALEMFQNNPAQELPCWGTVLGSAWDVLMEAETTGDLYFTNPAETDPAGRYRMYVGGSTLLIDRKTEAGDPGTWANMVFFDGYGLHLRDGLLAPQETRTIADGELPLIGAIVVAVDTEGGTSTDDLDTIVGLHGQILIIRPANTYRSIVVKHDTGNILCGGNADIVLDDIQDLCLLSYEHTADKWYAFGPTPTHDSATVAAASDAALTISGQELSLLPVVRQLQGWITDDNQNPTIGVLPDNHVVLAANVWVQEAFNSDGTDTLQVGFDADTDGYVTSTDVSTTGVKTVTLGVVAQKVVATAKTVEAYYLNSGSEPTTGKAHVALTYIVATALPA